MPRLSSLLELVQIAAFMGLMACGSLVLISLSSALLLASAVMAVLHPSKSPTSR